MNGREFAEEYFQMLGTNQPRNFSQPSTSTERRSFGDRLRQAVQETAGEIDLGLKNITENPLSIEDVGQRKAESARIQKLYGQYQGLAPFLSDADMAGQTARTLEKLAEDYRLAAMTSDEINGRIQELEEQTKREKASDPFSWLSGIFGTGQQNKEARNPSFSQQQKAREEEITQLKQRLYYAKNEEALNTLPENLRQGLYEYARNSAALDYVNAGGKGFDDTIAGQNSTYLLRDGNRYAGKEIVRMANSLRENPGAYGQLNQAFEAAGYDLDELLKYVETVQGEKYTQESAKDYQQTAQEHPVLTSIASVLQAPFSLGGFADTLETAVSNAVTGEERPIDLSQPAYMPSRFRSTTRAAVAENIDSDIGKLAYTVGMGLADMATTLPLYAVPGGQLATLALNAGNAAADTAVDITQRGGTPSQAMTGALAAGMAEVIFDKIGLDNIFDTGNIRGAKGLVVNLLKSAGVEAAEETATEFVNILADQAIMGDQSAYNQNVENYVQQGMSREEAESAARADLAKQMGLAAVGGAVGGGLFGSLVQVPAYIAGRRQAGTQSITDAGVDSGAEGGDTDSRFFTDNRTESPSADAREQNQGGLLEAADPLGFSAEDGGTKSVRSILDNAARKQAGDEAEYGEYAATEHAQAKEPVIQPVTQPLVSEKEGGGTVAVPETGMRSGGPMGYTVPDMSAQAKRTRAQATRESGTAAGAEPAVIELAAEVAANTGRNIQFVATLGEGINGRYDSGTNTLTIAADSQSPLETVLKHELTHSLEETGAYTALRDYMVREVIEPSLSQKGVHIADVVEAKMAQYAEAGTPLRYDEALREVVADYSAAKLFTDEAAIRRLTAKRPGLARRILNWIRSMYERVRLFLRGTPEERRLFRAQQLYQDALQSPMARRDGTQLSLVGRNEHGMEVYETSPEIKKLSYRERMKVFLDIMENQYKGRTAKFLRNGHPYYAGFESSDVRKNIYGDKRSDSKGQKAKINVGADGDIFELVENAHYNGSRPESGKSSQAHKGVSYWDYFIKTVQIDGVIYDLVANIRKKADGSYVYSIQLNENKRIEAAPPLSNDVAGNNVALNRAFTTSIDTSVTQNTPDVNTSISENGGLDAGKQSIGTTSGDIDQDMLELVNRYSRRQETPIDIAQMRPEDANTTPPVTGSGADTGNGYTAPPVRAKRGDSQSRFAESLQGSPVVDERFKTIALEDIGINTYDSVSNQETLAQANNALNDGGYRYVTNWFSQSPEKATAEDIAAGIILMSRYQAVGDYEGMVNATRKLREMGSNAGQTVQMFSILGRMTPEGMVHYAQKSLDDAFEQMVKNRSKAWADRNREKFRLTDEDVQFILDKTQKAAKLPAGRDKTILLGEIAARIQNKLPAEKGQNTRALARISMLLNPKTFLRNVIGNVSITPVSWIDDLIGSGIDRAVSKASGTRTTGGFQPSSAKGLWEGAAESFSDWRRKINTRDIDADRFEIGQGGPDFSTDHKLKPLNAVSRGLNALDRFTSFTLDVGDRPFFNMWFMNSLNNQMKLNGVSKPTAEMIEVARQDALGRTWQDTNGYTKLVSKIKNALNAVNVGGYGLGDVFIKFTKTPANLTKALVDYSPVGAVRAIASDGRKLSRALKTGEATPQLQRKFVNSLSKGITGSLLMVVMGAMANAGILKGQGSDDPDVANFEENVLGLQPYSVKIGDKTYSYEWMQPLGGTAAIVSDIVQTMKEGDVDEFFSDDPEANAILSAIQSGGQVLYNQSFMQSLANLFESDGMVQGLLEGLLAEPSTFVPQFFSQTATLTDDTARRSYVSGRPLDTAANKVKAKIPGLRSDLEPVVDVLGRDVPSNNSLWNVFLNPANTSAARPTEAANEMYRLYKATGDLRVIPPKAPNAITYTSGGETVKKTLTAQEKTEFQRITGQIAQNEVERLTGNQYYEGLTEEEKADLVSDIYSYASAVAKSELSDYPLSTQNEKRRIVESTGLSVGDYLLFNLRKDADGNGNVSQQEMRKALEESDFTEGQKAVLWELQNSAWKLNPYRSQDDYVEKILRGALE